MSEVENKIDKMSNDQIEKAFDKMVAAGDELVAKSKDGTISEKAAKEVFKAIQEEDNDEIKTVLNLPSNNGVIESDGSGVPENSESEVQVDPVTGLMREVPEKVTIDDIDREMAKLLDMEPEDLVNLPSSINDVPFDEELVSGNVKNYCGVDDIDTVTGIIEVIKKYRKTPDSEKEKINWYNEMPETVKDAINKQCAMVPQQNIKSAKKLFANEIIVGLIRDAGIDRMTVDLNNVMQEFNNAGNELISMSLDLQRSSMEESIDKYIENLEESKSKEGLTEEDLAKIEENITLFNKVKDAFIESYRLEGLLDMLRRHKIRVRPIDVKDRYAKHCNDFLYKYSKDTPFIIHDISLCTPILHRRFPEYTVEEVAKFIVAFIRYTMNYNAKDVVDHTFMYYFIHNIIHIDYAIEGKDQKEHAFVNLFCGNIERGIRLINGHSEFKNESGGKDVADGADEKVLQSTT